MAENQVYLIKSGQNSFVEETQAIVGISGGKVGIGTTVPEADFHVAGDTQIDGDLTVKGNFTTVDSTTIQVDDKNIELGVGSSTDAAADGGGITLHGGTNNNKTFNWYNDTDAWTSSEHLHLAAGKNFAADAIRALGAGGLSVGDDAGNGIFIEDGGQVGIGTTNPGYDLDVNGSGNFDSLYIQGNSVLTGDGSIFGKWEDGATAGEIYYNGGNVGVGVVDPSARLHVVGTSLLNGDVSASTIKAIDAGGLTLGDDAGNGIFVEDGGQIGINTTSPNYNLHVNGTTHVGGDFSVGSEFKISAGGAIGGTAPASDGDIIRWDDANNKWVAGANLGGGGGGGVGEVPAATINSLPSGQSVYEIEFAETYNVEPRIATQLEIDGDGSIIPYVVSGVSTSGYHLIFAQDIPNNNYRIHTTFGGRDVHWETGSSASLYYNDGDVSIQRNFTIGGNLTVNGTTTTVNTETVEIEDHNLVIAANTGYNQLDSQYPAGGAYAGVLWGTGDAGAASPVSLTYQTNKGFAFAGGNVGIGTTNPTNELCVNDSDSAAIIQITSSDTSSARLYLGDQSRPFRGGLVYNNSDDSLAFWGHDASAQTAERMRIDSNGNVGIGTTNPGVALDVNGDSNTQLRLTASDSLGASMINFGDQNNVAVGRIIYSHINDTMSFKTNNFNNRLVIDSSGNVGIGTASPTKPLHILSTVADQIVLEADSTTIGPNMIFKNTDGNLARLRTDDAENLHFENGTVNTTRMTIDSDGNIGIGTTNPDEKLTIFDNIKPVIRLVGNGNNVAGTNFGEIQFYNSDDSADGPNVAASIHAQSTSSTGSGGSLVFSTENSVADGEGRSADPRMTINSDGNVGIGTTNPGNKLHIAQGTLVGGSTNSNTSLTIEDALNTGIQFLSATQTQLRFGDADSDGAGSIIYEHANNLLRLNTTGAIALQGGNVGIGTTNPRAKFEVASAASNSALLFNVDTGENSKASIQSVDEDQINNLRPLLLNPAGGNVGIGTTGPSEGLSIVGPAVLKAFSVNTPEGRGFEILLGDSLGSTGPTLQTNTIAGFNMRSAASGFMTLGVGTEHMRIDSGGNVGIGTTNPGGFKLNVQADINTVPIKGYRATTTATSYLMALNSNIGAGSDIVKFRVEADGDVISATNSYTSDERAKTEISDLNYGIDTINQLQPKQFKMLNSEEKGFKYGFVAQEIETVLPDLVREDGVEDGEGGSYKALEYNSIIAVLTKAIQEQQQIIEDLKSQNSSLESRISALES